MKKIFIIVAFLTPVANLMHHSLLILLEQTLISKRHQQTRKKEIELLINSVNLVKNNVHELWEEK